MNARSALGNCGGWELHFHSDGCLSDSCLVVLLRILAAGGFVQRFATCDLLLTCLGGRMKSSLWFVLLGAVLSSWPRPALSSEQCAQNRILAGYSPQECFADQACCEEKNGDLSKPLARPTSRFSKPLARPTSRFGTCPRDFKPANFAAKACYVKKFNPTETPPYGGKHKYERPTCDGQSQITDDQKIFLAKAKILLARAYELAPEYVQARLCRLTQLFVTPSDIGTDWSSWGFWEAPDRPPGTGIFIGISESVLAGTMTLDALEASVLDRLPNKKREDDDVPRFRFPKGGGDEPAHDPALATLAVLAHELGHILLARTNADGIYPNHPRRKWVDAPVDACFATAFLGQSWDRRQFQLSMRRWVPFGNPEKNRTESGVDTSSTRKIYGGGHFVGAFATISPEEDLIETYRYKVLADANLNSPLSIKLPEATLGIELKSFLNAPVISSKIACIRRLGLLSGRP